MSHRMECACEAPWERRTPHATPAGGHGMFEPANECFYQPELKDLEAVLKLAARSCGAASLHLFVCAAGGDVAEAHSVPVAGESGRPLSSAIAGVRTCCRAAGDGLPLPSGTLSLDVLPEVRSLLWVPPGSSVPDEVLDHLRSAIRRSLQTRQQLARHAIERSRLRDFARASGDWLWETDESDCCSWVSPNFESCTGYAAELVVGRPVRPHRELDWLGQPVVPPRTFAQVLASRGLVNVVCGMGRRDRRRVISIRAVPRFRADGAFAGYRGVCRDVTDRVRLEQDSQLKAAAQEANRAKSEFLSKVSHELRTPLNAILGLSELLMERRALSPEGEAWGWLKIINSSGQYLLGMVNGLLELGRIEQGTSRLVIEDVAADEVVRFARMISSEGDGRAGAVTVRERYVGPSPVVKADRLAFEQIMVNLLSNAYKYNRPGGAIEVTVEQRETWVELSVSDTGIGIPPQRRGELFKPFHRLGAEQGSIAGSGLGLSICKALATSMGGDLAVESVEGQGTTCRLRLPAGNAAADGPTVPGQPLDGDAGDVAPQQVLYIEDDPVNALLATEAVRSIPGWRITVLGTVKDGIAFARRAAPDIVLLDMNLPDGDGFQAFDHLRRHSFARWPSCVALSADCMPQQIAGALAYGFDGYWTKPIGVAELRRRLLRLASDRRLPLDTV